MRKTQIPDLTLDRLYRFVLLETARAVSNGCALLAARVLAVHVVIPPSHMPEQCSSLEPGHKKKTG